MSQITQLLEIKGNKLKMFTMIGVTAVILAIAIFWLSMPNKGFVVKVDNQEVAVIASETVYTEALAEVKALKSESLGLVIKDVVNDVIVEPMDDSKNKPLAKEELVKILTTKLQWLVEATAISINGEPKVYMAKAEDGEAVLQKLKDEFTLDQDNRELLKVEFEETITLTTADVKISQIVDPERAVSLILNGTNEIETYKVEKGDTLWDIAYGNNMTVTELKEANPQLAKDTLSIGQELNLVKTEPMVHVVTLAQFTKEENIPFETKYISNSDLWRGQTTVKETGKSGKQLVTYKVMEKNGIEITKEVLEQEIIEQPQTKVVYQGTKMIVASRGGGGSGQLAWPLRGQITSPYGNRRLGFHTGMDINGVTGDPVYAAESGTVVKAGWSGNYGYCVDIDHGDGLLTKYAHLSKIDVKTGQKISRGDLVGRVGSTGRSTGSHLHFEVRINGNHKNPINYLR